MTFSEATYYTIEVTLTAKKVPVVTGVTVTPGQAQMKLGERLQFKATVAGSDLTDTSVTWSVSGGTSADTKIDEQGILTVGADENARELTVKATSNQDNSPSISAMVTVQQEVPRDTQPTTVDEPEEEPVLWIVLAAVAVAAAAAIAVVLVLKKKK